MDKVRRDVGANDGAGATEAGSLDSGNSIRRAPPAVPTSSEMSELAQLRTALDSSTRELRAEIQSLRSDLETLKRDLGN